MSDSESRAYCVADVRAGEAALMSTLPDGELMSRAAFGLAVHIARTMMTRCGGVTGRRVVLLVGQGGNGGDTLYAGAHLVRRGVSVLAILSGSRAHDGGLRAFASAGGRVTSDVEAALVGCDVVVDGMLGIGSQGCLRAREAELVACVAACDPRPVVVAADVPSGVGVDDGSVDGTVLPADLTVTFGAYKNALLLPPAEALAGRIELVDIGLGAALDAQAAAPSVLRPSAATVRGAWPVPTTSSHKYTRGVLGVVAGSAQYPGAAVLAVGGAQRCGLGMVRYVGPREAGEAVRARWPESVPSDGPCDGRVQAWLIGPGVAESARSKPSASTATTDGVAPSAESDQQVLARHAIDAAIRDGIPAVIDAGGISLIPKRLAASVVLTPHAGELAALLTSRGVRCSRADVEAHPLDHVQRAVDLTGATILLKGNVTLVAGPGDGTGVAHLWSVASATPWLATAGAGDVLSGIIGALLAGRSEDVMSRPALASELAAIAAMVHGRAARRAAGLSASARRAEAVGHPIVASDVVEHLPHVIEEMLS